MSRPFDPIQEEMLLAITEAMFDGTDMAIPATQVVENIQQQFELMTGTARDDVGLSLVALAVVLGGPLFLLKSPAARMRAIEKMLARTQIDLLQDLGRVRGVIYAGYYGHWQGVGEDDNRDNPVLAQIGFTLPKFRTRSSDPAVDVSLTYVPGRDLTHQDFVGHDALPARAGVIVIGSGAGGAVAAASLAGHGHDVLVIEAGAHYPSTRLTHEERRMTAKLFVNGALQTSKDHDFIIFQGRCVGGSTVINNGIALRVKQQGMTHPQARDVLDHWRSIGAPIDETAFEASYAAVEARLDIREIEHRSGRTNGPHLLNGWAARRAATGDPQDAAAIATWFHKNFGPQGQGVACAYCGYCNTGCPYGRKHGMAQSYLLDARRAGARILAEATVKRILWSDDMVDGKRVADGVEIELEEGGTHIIWATTGVVVAAGTMASSRILDASGIAGTGNQISLNIACPVVGLMPEGHKVNAWDEDQMATYVDRGDFLIESHFQPPMSMSTLMPGWGAEHHRRMLNYNRLVSAGVLFPADRRGWLDDGKLAFKLHLDEDLPLLRRALAALIDVHFRAGAIEVYPALARGDVIRPGENVDAWLKQRIREADDVTLSSSHPHGGNAINADPMLGVVDPECRVHGTANVLVTDASVFPSCIRVNAQLTTMAMAHYATARVDPFRAS